ncbi:MAG: putative ABC exporter domain-containing protein [Longimicrobiales bacterium]
MPRSSVPAFAFLIRASMRNRLARQRRRLRKARYLIGLLLGIAYFAFLFLSNDRSTGRGFANVGEVVGPLIVALYLAWSWLWGGARDRLTFSPAEVQHLFPAPVTRRTLLHYKLVRSQIGLLFSGVLLALLLDESSLPLWLRVISFWLLFMTMQLHQIAASLVHTSADTQGITGLRRNAIPLVLFAVMLGGLLWSVFAALPELRAASQEQITQRLGDAMRAPVARVVLFPIRVLLAPILAGEPGAWARALGPALLLLALHYIWVIRTDAAFEEAAAEAGLRRARHIDAVRAGGRTDAQKHAHRDRALLFPLRAHGYPASALVWKNLIGFVRGLKRNTLFLIFAAFPFLVVGALGMAESARRGAWGLAIGAIALAGMSIVFGPLGIRNDLRQDLMHIGLLRTYPLRGRAIVGAEVGSSAIILSVGQLALLAVAAVGFAFAGEIENPAWIAIAAAIALLTLPALNGLALAIQNGLALYFPDWMRVGTGDPSGVEFMGQNILRLAGSFLLLGLGLLPPLLIGGLAGFGLIPQLGPLAAVPAILLGVAALWAEVVLIIVGLGDAFERTDPVEAGLPS